VFGDSSGRNDVGSAHLYFAVERSANQELKFLWRSVDLPSGLDELGVEQLVQVIHLSSLALWEGSVETSRAQLAEKLGRERGALPLEPSPHDPPPTFESGRLVEAPPVVAPYQPPAPTRRSLPLVGITHATVAVSRERHDGAFDPTLGIGYVIRWRGPERAAIGPEMMLGANLWFGEYALGFRATWQSLSTQAITLAPAEFDVSGNSFRFGGHATLKISRTIELKADLGAGLDIIRYRTTRTTDPQLEPELEPHDLRPFVYLGMGAQHRVGPFGLGLSALLAAQVLDTRYGVANSGKFASYMTPWRVQPGLRLELSWQ
jgi:hypothetical protein